jgi:hypothetical protein
VIDSREYSKSIAVAVVTLFVVSSTFVGGASAASAAGGTNANIIDHCHEGWETSPMPSFGVPHRHDGDWRGECRYPEEGEESSGGDGQPPEVESFDAKFTSDTEVTVTVEFDEDISSGHVNLFDGDGNRLGDGRLVDTTSGRHVYDTHFQVAGEAGDTYRAVLDDAEDSSGNEVQNPSQYEDTVSVATPEPTATETPVPTETATPAPTPDDTPSPTTAPTTSDDGAGDGDADDGGPLTTTTVATESGGDDPTSTDEAAEDPGTNDGDDGGPGMLILLVVLALIAVAAAVYRMRQ